MQEWLPNAARYVREHGAQWATQIFVGLVVLLVGWFLARLAGKAAERALRRASAPSLAPMVSTLVRLTVFVAAMVMALDQVGVDITTVLAGAGVLGLAIGFGAQTLVKDCISGFFMVIEDIVEEGDWVDLDGKFGVIENVGLRVTQLRAFDGTLWAIPNGEIKVIGNRTKGWMRAIVTVGIAYEGDLARGLSVLQSVGDRFAAEHPEALYSPDDPPQAQGVVAFDDSSVAVRLVIRIRQSKEGEVWPTERLLRRMIKEAFDAEGIEIPFPRRVVYSRPDAPDEPLVEDEAA